MGAVHFHLEGQVAIDGHAKVDRHRHAIDEAGEFTSQPIHDQRQSMPDAVRHRALIISVDAQATGRIDEPITIVPVARIGLP